MKATRLIMGMPITVEIVSENKTDAQTAIEKVFDYFESVDERFSTYKPGSEISRINRGEIQIEDCSSEMKEIFALAEETKKQTNGYFDISLSDKIDPSGLVKGWAILNAAKILEQMGFKNFYVEAGGDIQAKGTNQAGQPWKVGIKNPFDQKEIVKVVYLKNCGIATSGNYIRGQHIYNPKNLDQPITEIVSLTVIGPNVYEAYRFATAAFAMGKPGINFIEQLPELDGYIIDKDGIATMTSGFERFTFFTKY